MRTRRPRWRGLAAATGLLVLLTSWSATADARSDGAPSQAAHAAVHCAAAKVHYQPYAGMQRGLRVLPWVAASPASAGLVAHLFYYGHGNRWSKQRLPQLRIYSGGETPDGSASTKILWELRHSNAMTIQLRGTRLDHPGSFAQQFSPAGHAQFPSIVDVPTPGCWRLTLTAGNTISRLIVDAVPGPHN